jgi:hypothetical protein
VTFLAGFALACLSAWWATACQARRAWQAAASEGFWALAVVAGVGGAVHDPWSAYLFALGAAAGTWLVIFCARPAP